MSSARKPEENGHAAELSITGIRLSPAVVVSLLSGVLGFGAMGANYIGPKLKNAAFETLASSIDDIRREVQSTKTIAAVNAEKIKHLEKEAHTISATANSSLGVATQAINRIEELYSADRQLRDLLYDRTRRRWDSDDQSKHEEDQNEIDTKQDRRLDRLEWITDPENQRLF